MIPNIRAGAVLYTKDTVSREALSVFARELQSRGWRVGGVVQETTRHEKGYKTRVDSVDLLSGQRIAINLPTQQQIENNECSLNLSALTESSAVLRHAIEEKVDLIVVEKFGEQEQQGGGLSAEILAAMAEGIPTLVAVPAGVIETWQTFSGGCADLLAMDMAALWRWWGASNAREELIRDVSWGETKRVVVGLNWTLVEGPDGCGLAQSPRRNAPGCQPLSSGALSGRPLFELAALARSWNPFETAIGIAAINAHYNRYDLSGSAENGLDVFANLEGPVTVVGRFPGLAERLQQPRVIEFEPRPGEFPTQAAASFLSNSEAVVLTASTLVNHSFEQSLQACRGARVALVGPSTPLYRGLHAYGVEVLAGQVIEDTDAAVRVVQEGGSVKAFKPFSRLVTLKR